MLPSSRLPSVEVRRCGRACVFGVQDARQHRNASSTRMAARCHTPRRDTAQRQYGHACLHTKPAQRRRARTRMPRLARRGEDRAVCYVIYGALAGRREFEHVVRRVAKRTRNGRGYRFRARAAPSGVESAFQHPRHAQTCVDRAGYLGMLCPDALGQRCSCLLKLLRVGAMVTQMHPPRCPP